MIDVEKGRSDVGYEKGQRLVYVTGACTSMTIEVIGFNTCMDVYEY